MGIMKVVILCAVLVAVATAMPRKRNLEVNPYRRNQVQHHGGYDGNYYGPQIDEVPEFEVSHHGNQVGHHRNEVQHYDELPEPDLQCKCPRLYRPVCGSDIKTYPSRCNAMCSGRPRFLEGRCEDLFNHGEPIPAADDAVVHHDFEVSHHDLEVSHHGNEVTHHGNGNNCACGADFNQVCGADGRTYSNRCLATCNQVTRTIPGPCDQVSHFAPTPVDESAFTRPCVCPASYDPVCGSDRRTYASRCLATCNFMTRTIPGPCEQVTAHDYEEAECSCRRNDDPVCDGQETYPNLCVARCRVPGLTRWIPGACFSVSHHSNNGNSVTHHGNNGNSVVHHGNNGNSVAHHGNSNQNCWCTLIYNPVCGYDGSAYRLYASACIAKCNGVVFISEQSECNDDRESQERPIKREISFVKRSRGCEECTAEFEPVCQGRTTYVNRCVAMCYDKFDFTYGACPRI